MKSESSTEEYLALYEVPSTSQVQPVYDTVRALSKAVLTWDAPFYDAEYITMLVIGESGDPKAVAIVFSRWGNLCYVHSAADSVIGRDILEKTLIYHDWVIMPPDVAKIVLKHPLSLYDLFFSLS
jgi:hypothetical protein